MSSSPPRDLQDGLVTLLSPSHGIFPLNVKPSLSSCKMPPVLSSAPRAPFHDLWQHKCLVFIIQSQHLTNYELLHNGNDDVDHPTEVTDGGDRNVWGDVNSPTGVKIVKLVNY